MNICSVLLPDRDLIVVNLDFIQIDRILIATLHKNQTTYVRFILEMIITEIYIHLKLFYNRRSLKSQ
jgi:hypothetical protein